MSHVKLYDLAGGTEKASYSPNTLKVHIALNIKGIPYETERLDFLQVQSTIPNITKSGVPPTVPVIVDKKHQDITIQDSWKIVKYLDNAYPATPRLIQTDNEALQFFFYNYCHTNILIPAFGLCVLTIHDQLPSDELKNYFRTNREALFHVTLEQFAGEEHLQIAALKSGLGLIHSTLKSYPYLSGDKAGFADVTLAASMRMLAAIRDDLFEQAFLEAFPDDILRNWWNLMSKYIPL